VTTPHAAFDSPSLRKARGAFFTPPEVANFIVDWAVRSPDDRTFEPSCGDAIFMHAAARRLRTLGARGDLNGQLHGAEIHAPSGVQAVDMLRSNGFSPTIALGDFFDFPFAGEYDAVVGNPPYVRYQEFSGEARRRAREKALAAGVPLTGLASSWAAFVVHAAQLTQANGRLGLVLPAELLAVNYAAPVRRFLMERFARVRLVMFHERVFPGVLEEVVLLLAEGAGPTDKIEICEARNVDDLSELHPVYWSPKEPEDRWTPALVADDSFALYASLVHDGDFVELEAWGATGLGMVTGNNRYFALTVDEVRQLRIPERDLLRISPPGSRHLRGLTFTDAAWNELASEGRRVYLFLPDREKPSAAARRYIEEGEAAKVEAAYKCRVRTPWWRVPTIRTPDLFLTYMNHDTPRLVTNAARVSYVNSIHGVRLAPPHRALGRKLLPVASLNTATLLGAEIVGRSYGGGMLKLEPKEADLLPVPSPTTVAAAADDLAALAPHVARTLRKGDLVGAVKMVDDVLLIRHVGLKRAEVRNLREAREAMFARRAARGGK
jgi:adenine-specific DNA-methyltransferase